MKRIDVDDLVLALQGNLKHPVNVSDLSVEEQLSAYYDVFGEKVLLKHWFIQVQFYNPCSHEMDWRIISEENEETLSEENAMLFTSVHDAENWTKTDEAKKWLPCTFMVKESIY